MCRSMVDIQSVTAEIRRGKKRMGGKKNKKKKERNPKRKIKCPHLLCRAVITTIKCHKVWLMPLLECSAVTLPRRETRSNLQGCPKLANRSQPLVGQSSPYYQNMWRRYCCLTSFFPIVDTCLSSEDIARQSCAMVPKLRFFCVLYIQRTACSTFQTCILKSH